MARWLVGDRIPLAARVLANRLWAEMFGHGIVETLEDFGTSGAKPTHPELLDHLALRLRGDFQWSVKRFLREIALSSTYAQTPKAPPWPNGTRPIRLYARGPRVASHRRDGARPGARAFRLLSPKAFGPPVYPPQPDGIWSTVYSGDRWNTSRTPTASAAPIYTYQKRTSGYPVFLTFDAPTRDACTARRLPSNTPLQALTALNDPAFIEMAQSLANRMEAGRRAPDPSRPKSRYRLPPAHPGSRPPPARHGRQPPRAETLSEAPSMPISSADPASADKLAPNSRTRRPRARRQHPPQPRRRPHPLIPPP
jgi:hypothetical protein